MDPSEKHHFKRAVEINCLMMMERQHAFSDSGQNKVKKKQKNIWLYPIIMFSQI